MNTEKSGDLHCVHITDRSQASPPGVAVTVHREQIPPEFHLFFQRGRYGFHYVLTACKFRRIVNRSGVLIRVAIVPARGQCIVRKERTVRELFGGPVEQVIEGRAVLSNAELVVDRRNPSSHAKVIFGKVDQRVIPLIVKPAGIKKFTILLALFRSHALPQSIAIQVRSEALQSHCGVELRPGFSPVTQFDSRHLSNHFWNVMPHNRLCLETSRIGAERTHERNDNRKSTRLNSSHANISYAVFCLKKKNK